MALEQFSTRNKKRNQRCAESAKAAGHPDWWAWVRAIEEESGRVICGAPKRKSYEPCKLPPAPNGRCTRFHGGTAAIGPAHPSYVTGKHSKAFDFLPSYLQDQAQSVYDDEKLIQSREEIAVLTAHGRDMLSRGLPDGESGAAWRACGEWVKIAVNAMEKQDAKELGAALARLADLTNNGIGEQAVWREYQQVVENTRRAKETEMKRLQYLSGFIAVDKAAALLHRMVDIIQTHVRDTNVLRLILLDVDKVFGRGAKNSKGEAA